MLRVVTGLCRFYTSLPSPKSCLKLASGGTKLDSEQRHLIPGTCRSLFTAAAPRSTKHSGTDLLRNTVLKKEVSHTGVSAGPHVLPERELVPSEAQRRTIYALSTPPGKAGVAVVRISGPDALKIWKSMVSPATKLKERRELQAPKPWRMYRCEVVHPQTRELLDSGLAVYFKGPRSFTGEDVVELHIHSGRAIISSVLEALAAASSCRLAEPGEFTRRAFEVGRLDLTEVEGLHDLINAETASQRRAALQAVEGKLRVHFEALRADILRSLSLVEALIDFGEEDVEENVYVEARELASSAIGKIRRHLTDYQRGEILKSGLRLAIFGPPNAGKSSLLNLLAQREAAIVTDIPGTTRDVLELSLEIGGLPVIVADTAGLRKTDDVVEKIGVERAIKVVSDADINLCVLSLTDVLTYGNPMTQGSQISLTIPSELRSKFSDETTFLLLNKSDLLSSIEDDVKRYIESISCTLGVRRVWVASLTTSNGIEQFLNEFGESLKARFDILQNWSDASTPLVINSRHRMHLETALRFLEAFLETGQDSVEEDIVLAAEELRYAAQAVGKISGIISVDDILDTIFRDFCIGK